MKLIKLKCEECQATINIEKNDHQKILFCTYCGTKQMMVDDIKNININRTYKKEDTARITESENKLKIEELKFAEKEKERKKERKNMNISLLFFLVIIGLFIIMGRTSYIGHIEEERNLQRLVEEIHADIANGDYAVALVKAQSLRSTSRWTSETQEMWDETRNILINIIEDAMEIAARGTPISVNVLIDFLASSDKVAEITIEETPIGIQSSGTIMRYYIQLSLGTNTINFTVGDLSESRNFQVLETDDYFHIHT